MPYQIIENKKEGYFQLKKLKEGTLVNKKYKSFETAKNAGFNFMRYRKEIPYMSGNKILNKKKNKSSK